MALKKGGKVDWTGGGDRAALNEALLGHSRSKGESKSWAGSRRASKHVTSFRIPERSYLPLLPDSKMEKELVIVSKGRKKLKNRRERRKAPGEAIQQAAKKEKAPIGTSERGGHKESKKPFSCHLLKTG